MSAKIDTSLAADVQAFLGATGTGKSHALKKSIGKDKRLLIWDIEDEYSSVETFTMTAIPPKMDKPGPWKYRFVPSMDRDTRVAQFNLFCKLAMAIGNLTLVAEELRFVTQPSKSPEWWAAVTMRGRKRGIKVRGTSQRPASIDKDFLSNATRIRCGALAYPEDRKAVAAVMGVDPLEIAALEGHQAIVWTRSPRKITREK